MDQVVAQALALYKRIASRPRIEITLPAAVGRSDGADVVVTDPKWNGDLVAASAD